MRALLPVRLPQSGGTAMPAYSITWNDEVPVLCAPRNTARAALLQAELLMRAHRPGVIIKDIFTCKIIPIDEIRERAIQEDTQAAPGS